MQWSHPCYPSISYLSLKVVREVSNYFKGLKMPDHFFCLLACKAVKCLICVWLLCTLYICDSLMLNHFPIKLALTAFLFELIKVVHDRHGHLKCVIK